MRIPPPVLLFCLLPYATIGEYDESSTRKINLEDIEDDHIKNEKQSQSMPPPLSKQPAKGQPVQLYPPLSNEAPIPNLFDAHHYSTRAHQHQHQHQQHAHVHVQPLTDQPTAPAQAGYQHQQSPLVYRGEEIVYIPAQGQQSSPHNHNQQQLYGVVVGQQQQQPSPHFYYSHDLPHQHSTTGNGNGHENEYQVQFVPIGQHGGSDEQQLQHSFHGPSSQVTVPSTAAPAPSPSPAPTAVQPVSYSHDVRYDEVPHPEMQQHPSHHQQLQEQQEPPAQYQMNDGIRDSNYAQHVYGLPPDVLFQSQRDIEYAKPADNYGPPPPLEYFKNKAYSQSNYSPDVTSPKTRTTPESSYQDATTYSDQIKSIDYQNGVSQLDSSSSNSQPAYSQKVKTQEPALSYGYENQLGPFIQSTPEPKTYFSKQQTGFKYNQAAEENKIPVISDGYGHFPAPSAPSDTQTYYLNHLKEFKTVHHADSANKPAIVYGPPDTVGQEPQIEYGVPEAPFRRPVAQSNQDIYAPRRPSSAGRGRSFGKNFAVSFPYPPSFVSFTTEKSSVEKAVDVPKDAESSSNNDINPWRPMYASPSLANQYRSFGQTSLSIDGHQSPVPDLFHTRRAKSLLDSYIPSWLVTRMQHEHSIQGQVNQKQQDFSVRPTQAEDAYNTISYSSQETLNGSHFKRSVVAKKLSHQKKKIQASKEEMTAMD